MDYEDGFFPITSVHRLDTKEALHLTDEQVASITDDMMRDIARKMADDYCEQLFGEGPAKDTRYCRNCLHFNPQDSTCPEGGFSEIGDTDRTLSEEERGGFRGKRAEGQCLPVKARQP